MLSTADRLAIQDLQIRYAIALDSRDWELLRTVFLPTAQVQYPGSPHLDGFEQTRAFCDHALSRYRIQSVKFLEICFIWQVTSRNAADL